MEEVFLKVFSLSIRNYCLFHIYEMEKEEQQLSYEYKYIFFLDRENNEKNIGFTLLDKPISEVLRLLNIFFC